MPVIKNTNKEKEDIRNERAKKIEILKNYTYLEDNIKEIEEMYKETSARLYSIKAIRYKDGSSSSNIEKNYTIEKLLDKKEELINLCKTELLKEYTIRNKMQEAVYKLENEQERNIIINKYFKNMTYYQIAEKINYSDRQVMRIHNKAIDNLKF